MNTAKIIVLCGTKASGKTSIGIELARLLNASFYDTDEQLQSKYPHNKTVREIFKELGDAGFRSLEAEVMNELLFKVDAESSRSVIALGGGACEAESFESFVHRLKQKNGTLIFLKPSTDSLLKRIHNFGTLPVTVDNSDFENNFRAQTERRNSKYSSLADFIHSSEKSPLTAALDIKRQFLEA